MRPPKCFKTLAAPSLPRTKACRSPREFVGRRCQNARISCFASRFSRPLGNAVNASRVRSTAFRKFEQQATSRGARTTRSCDFMNRQASSRASKPGFLPGDDLFHSMRFQFTIRDFFWLTLTVALTAGWVFTVHDSQAGSEHRPGLTCFLMMIGIRIKVVPVRQQVVTCFHPSFAIRA